MDQEVITPAATPKITSPLLYKARNLLIMLVLVVLFVECVGLPHIRTPSGYWSVTGMRSTNTTNEPLVLVLPLPKHTWTYATEYLQQH